MRDFFMPYKFIDHIADIAVEVSAHNLEELFKVSCTAWRIAAVQSKNSFSNDCREIYFQAESLEELLVNLLNELNFLLYSDLWVFNSVSSLSIFTDENKYFNLTANISGEYFSKDVHHFKEEIKATTYHQLKIEKRNNLYSTTIVFDI
jgi:SHS2 domain-containing protein